MIQFSYVDPKASKGVVKATTHKSGKLGFSSAAANMMNLTVETYFRVAFNAADLEDENLYLVLTDAQDDLAFKANKAGEYYYLSIKHVLDERDIDYKNDKVIYNIKLQEQQGIRYYELKPREKL